MEGLNGSEKIQNAFILCTFLGFLGFHNFYLKKYKHAILQLLTLGGLFIWVIIDWFLIITEQFKDREGKKLIWLTQDNYGKRAGFKIRLCAAIIDLNFFIGFIINLDFVNLGSYILDVASMMVTVFYYTIFTASKYRGTIGKMLCKIYVVTDTNQTLSLGRSFSRYLSYLISYMTIFIGFFMAGCTKEKKALHDFITKTQVIHGAIGTENI
jgi:uncharacterized RDD family membrane protein YckC